jgi:hypothetical protein
MKLKEALDQIDSLDESKVVFARKPWGLESEAVVDELDDQMRVPRHIAESRFEYFIDVPVAKEVLGVFGSRPVTAEQRRELLLYYAENDAYPDWAYTI